MKKIAITIILFCCLFELFGQEKLGQSIELQESSIYYFINDKYYDEYTNFYNYGVTLLYSVEVMRNLSCSMGINYSTKNYYREACPSEYQRNYERWEYYLKYINIPLFLNYRFVHTKLFEFKLSQGFYFNYRADQDIRIYETNEPISEINNLNKFGLKYNTDLTYRCSTILSLILNSRFNINLVPFFDYKFLIKYHPSPRPEYLTNNHVSCGASIGVEYKF